MQFFTLFAWLMTLSGKERKKRRHSIICVCAYLLFERLNWRHHHWKMKKRNIEKKEREKKITPFQTSSASWWSSSLTLVLSWVTVSEHIITSAVSHYEMDKQAQNIMLCFHLIICETRRVKCVCMCTSFFWLQTSHVIIIVLCRTLSTILYIRY